MIEFAGALVSAIAIITYIETRIRRELKPNGGSSVKDQLNRLEARVDSLVEHLITNK
jgi:hypothetical protein